MRGVGASVQSLAALGDGCPDLLVGYRGANYLLEVKDQAKAPSHRKLTDDQVRWHGAWVGTVVVVLSPWDALLAVGAAPPLRAVHCQVAVPLDGPRKARGKR